MSDDEPIDGLLEEEEPIADLLEDEAVLHDVAITAGGGTAAAERPLILLVDGRSLMRHCVARWLQDCWPDARVVAAATLDELAHADDRLALVRLAVLAASAGLAQDAVARALLAEMQALLGGRPVVVLAESEQAEDVTEAIRGGARGYLPTSLGRAAALEAMRFVLAGGVFVPASALVAGDPGTRPAGAGPVPLRLSPREREVADRLCAGKPNKTIARELEISESTVKVFVRRILTKVGASNRTEAAYLVRTRLRTPGERRPAVSAARV